MKDLRHPRSQALPMESCCSGAQTFPFRLEGSLICVIFSPRGGSAGFRPMAHGCASTYAGPPGLGGPLEKPAHLWSPQGASSQARFRMLIRHRESARSALVSDWFLKC